MFPYQDRNTYSRIKIAQKNKWAFTVSRFTSFICTLSPYPLKARIKIIIIENQFPLFIVDTVSRKTHEFPFKRSLYLMYVIFEYFWRSEVKASFIFDVIESEDLQENGARVLYMWLFQLDIWDLMDILPSISKHGRYSIFLYGFHSY